MALIYDLLVVLILTLFFAAGVKKGFIKSILSLICFIAAVAVSLFAAEKLAQPVYEMCFKERVTSFIEENIDKIDVTGVANSYLLNNLGIEADEKTIKNIIGSQGDINQNIQLYAKENGIVLDEKTLENNLNSFLNSKELENAIKDALPSQLADAVISAAESSSDSIGKILQACVNPDKRVAARALEDVFVNDALILLVKYALFLIIYIIIRFLLKLIVAATGIVNKIPIAGKVNRALGGAFGILKGGVFVVILALIISGLVSFMGSRYSLLSESTINNSLVFKYFYNIVR